MDMFVCVCVCSGKEIIREIKPHLPIVWISAEAVPKTGICSKCLSGMCRDTIRELGKGL
jgi:hypothetical protein